MSRTLTRREFDDLVWSQPTTLVAKELALPDVPLCEVCRTHGIPTPPLGWWAKKAAGRKLTRSRSLATGSTTGSPPPAAGSATSRAGRRGAR